MRSRSARSMINGSQNDTDNTDQMRSGSSNSESRSPLSQLKYFFLGSILTFFVYILLIYQGNFLSSYMEEKTFDDYLLTANDSDAVYDYAALERAEEVVPKVQLSEARVQMTGEFGGLSVFYREARPPAGVATQAPLLLLHGISNDMDATSDVWLQRNTMAVFAAAGYRVIAPDLPGTRMSRTSRAALDAGRKAGFVRAFSAKVAVDQAIVYGASWGGTFALPYLFEYGGDKMLALVAVAPVGSEWYSDEMYEKVDVPSMLIHGASDRRLGHYAYEHMSSIPHLRHVVIKKAGHAVFQERPVSFHAACLRFMQSVTDDLRRAASAP